MCRSPIMVMWLGYVWCLSSFLAHAFLRTLHTRHLRVASVNPTRTKHPVRSDKHLFSWHRGHPSRTRDVSHLSRMCSRRFSSCGAWVVRPSRSLFVFFRLRGWVRLQVFCSISGAPVLACHSHSLMSIRIRACVNRSTTHTPHLSHDCPARRE